MPADARWCRSAAHGSCRNEARRSRAEARSVVAKRIDGVKTNAVFLARLSLLAAVAALVLVVTGGCMKEERGSGTSARASAIVPRPGGMTRGDGRGMIGDRY